MGYMVFVLNALDAYASLSIIRTILSTLFRCQVFQPTNWGHHLYRSKVNGDLSNDRHKHRNTDMSPRAYGLTYLSEMTRKSNHLQMLECLSSRESNPSLSRARQTGTLPTWLTMRRQAITNVFLSYIAGVSLLPFFQDFRAQGCDDSGAGERGHYFFLFKK